MANHKTVKLKLGRRTVDIDEKLAPLILQLWDLDIVTEQCCQERYPGLAQIAFPSTFEAACFLNVAQRNYWVDVETWDEGDFDEHSEHAFRVNLFVLFPTADILRLTETFKNYQPEQ